MSLSGAVLEWKRPDSWQPWISDLRQSDDADLVGELRRRFVALRAFHAARPTNLIPYQETGITPLDRERWGNLIESCFLSQITDPALAAAVRDVSSVQFELIRHGRVHFCCDEHLLEERDGYHLIYGSLSLLAVAIQIDKRFGCDFKSSLRRRGEPVIFVCDIPTARIEDDVLARLVAALREAHAYQREDGRLPTPFDFHFSIPGGLEPAAIAGHHAPRYVIDTVYGHDIREETAQAEAPR